MRRRGWRSSVILTLVALAPFLIASSEEAAAPAAPEHPAAGEASDVLRFNVLALPRRSNDALQHPAPIAGQEIPHRLYELLDDRNLPDEFRDGLAKNNFSAVDQSVIVRVPVVILLHISAPFLSTCNPRALSALVKEYPGDAVLARAVLAALDLSDSDTKTTFIRQLGLTHESGKGLSVEVQSVIAEAAVRWWGKDMKGHTTDLASVGTPLLAALPPGYLMELPPDHAANMLMELRNHPWQFRNDPAWSDQPPETKRVWMELFKKDPASGKAQLITAASDGLLMLWAGATSDEINDLQYEDTDVEDILKLRHLTKLQVRAFLEKLYPQSALSAQQYNHLHDWISDLSPGALQRFEANENSFDRLPSFVDISRASVPTLKQLVEMLLASMAYTGSISNVVDPGSWGVNLRDLGRLAFLIRAEHFKKYSEQGHSLPLSVLGAIDTYNLSPLQARYLTRNGELLDLTQMRIKDLQQFHGLLRAISTGRLAALQPAKASEDKLRHLLESIPFTHIGRSAVLFNKERASLFVEDKVLKAVLLNPEPGQFLSLVSAREVESALAPLEKTFSAALQPLRSPLDFFTPQKNTINLKSVPMDTLSAVLGAARRQLASAQPEVSEVWNSESLLDPRRPLVSGALLGLSCADVFNTQLVDLPVIVAEFNRRLRDAGLVFPKRLQYCLQRAMEDYLEMKKGVRRGGSDVPLVAYLEPSDIEAFGGYVVATLMPLHIHHSPHSLLILSTIGSLSPRELLPALRNQDAAEKQNRPLEYATEYALMVVDLFAAQRSVGPRCLFALGNLHMFLPPDVISAIEPAAFKVFVEAAAGRPQSLAVCANGEQRDAWHRLVIKTFGPPNHWSAGVVAALGDVLAVLPADVLASIRVSSWKEAADTLAQRTVYHLPTHVHGSDYPLPFVDVCRSLLDEGQQAPFYWQVRRLLRYYLRAAQAQMDTVERADQLIRRLQQRSARLRPGLSGQRSAGSATTTSTTPSTTTETEQVTTPSTTTTTTEDPFGDFEAFLSERPSWMQDVLTSTSKPAPPPKTVILTKDDASGDAGGATTLPPTMESASPGSSEAPGPATDKDLLTAWDEAKDKMAVLSSTAKTSSVTSSVYAGNTDIPLAVTLPTMAMYPNKSDDDSGAAIKLSNATLMYAESIEESASSSPKEPATNPDPDTNLVRRRRGVDDFSVEMEHQIERDVPMAVTCDAVRTLGGAASLALVQGDPEHMLDVEAEDCVEELSKLNLGRELRRKIWSKLSPLDRTQRLGDLGGLVAAMSVDEVGQFNLSLANVNTVDVLSVIGQNVHDDRVLAAVAKQLELQNPSLRRVAGGGEPHPPLDADSLLVALGPVACQLPLDVLRLLLSRRGALLHAARSLQGVRFHCEAACLHELANAAVSDAALGSPDKWTSEEVRDLGVIVAGLTEEQLALLRRPANARAEQPFSGLTASAVTCMTPEQIKTIGDDLDKLTSVAASAVTPVQQTPLDDSQMANLIRVRHNVFQRALDKPFDHDHDGGSSTRQAASPAALALCLVILLVLGAGRSL